jgi:uncharacterized protein YbjT (DUF2867 family)
VNVIVTGATGLAGSEVLRAALADAEVGRVTVLSRRPLAVEHGKLDLVIHEDFTSYEPLAGKLAGHAAILWCLGIAQSKVTKAEYEKITFDYAVEAAKALAALEPKTTFCFLSGQGADSKERSRILFSRIKGKTENELLRILPNTYCFRPGYIRPQTPFADRPWSSRVLDRVASGVQRVSRGLVMDTEALAQAMLVAAKRGAPKHVLENADIQAMT